MRRQILALVLAFVPASLALAISTTTVSFQNGVAGYTGTYDRYIAQTPDAGIDGSALPDVTLIGNTQQGLIKFDNIFGTGPGQIPLGARILDASLQLSTIGGADASPGPNTSNGPYTVAALTNAFNNTTTFATYSGGHGAWFEDGHTTRPQGNYGRLDAGETQATDIRSIVQAWSDGGVNHGMAVNGGFPSGTDDWQILTTGNSSPGSRPKLSVTYTTDNVPVNIFQRGLNGYTNVDSARVSSKCNTNGTGCDMGGTQTTTTTNGNSIGSMTLQLADAGSTEQIAMFRFNDVFGANPGQAPADKPVAKAFLVLTTLTSSNTAARIPAPVDAYELNTSFMAPGSFNNNPEVEAGDYVTWRKNEVANAALPNDNGLLDQAARYALWRSNFGKSFKTFDQFGPNIGLQSGDGDITQETLYRTPAAANDSEIWFDVTGYAERIRNGAVNNGIAIQARSTDGWQFVMNGTTNFDARRPRLVVMSDLSLPGPPQPTTVLKYDASPKNEILSTSSLAPLDVPAARTPTGVTGLPMTRGAGITGAGLGQGFSARDWNAADKNAAIASAEYYEWGMTLDASHTASLSALDLTLRRGEETSANTFELQASFDNFATAPIVLSPVFTYMGRANGNAPTPDPSLDTPFFYMNNDVPGRPNTTFSSTDPIPTVDLTAVSQLQNIAAGSTLKFRLYAWGATSPTASLGFRVTGPKVTGIVSSTAGLGTAMVPEPSCFMLAAMLGTLLVARRPARQNSLSLGERVGVRVHC